MAEIDRIRWNSRYRAGDAPVRETPNRWLARQAARIDARQAACPEPRALDLACGTGGTVRWLAQRGWRVTGVDVSEAALDLAWAALAAAGLAAQVTFLHADLDGWRPAPASYDLITCFYFLDRSLWPSLRAALCPGGLICMQTFHTGQLALRPQTDPAHLLAPGELAALLTGWGWRILAAETTATTEAVLGISGALSPG
jgi:SAM-dependent methyltransferase